MPNNPLNQNSGGGRVVSERVIGSSNPIARYFRNLIKSVGGVLLGLILFFGSFGVMWYSENFTEHSVVVEGLEISQPAMMLEETVKFEGPVEVLSYATAMPNGEDVLFYSYLQETCELEIYTETQVVTRDGQDIEQTIEKERNVWKGEVDEGWGEFSVAGIPVLPTEAKNRLTLTELSKDGDYSGNDCIIGATRHKTEGFIPSESTTLLVVGDYLDGSVSGGETFIVTDLNNEELIAKLQAEEKALFWMLKAAAVITFAVGLTLILSPIAMLLNILPGLGKMLQILILIVSLIIGVVVVLLATIILKLWWLILLALIALGVYTWKKKKALGKT